MLKTAGKKIICILAGAIMICLLAEPALIGTELYPAAQAAEGALTTIASPFRPAIFAFSGESYKMAHFL